jgi:hypothetical protein
MTTGNPVLLFASIDISGSTAFKRSTPHWKALLIDFFIKIQPFTERIWLKHKNIIEQDTNFMPKYRGVFKDYAPDRKKRPPCVENERR